MQTVNIFIPRSPSTNISVNKSKAIKFTISWGGGMGGANQKIYATKVSRKGDVVIMTSVDGQVYKVTKNFIVMEKEVSIIKLVTDVTAHANYSAKTCNKSILTQYFSINTNEDYLFNNVVGKNPEEIYLYFEKS